MVIRLQFFKGLEWHKGEYIMTDISFFWLNCSFNQFSRQSELSLRFSQIPSSLVCSMHQMLSKRTEWGPWAYPLRLRLLLTPLLHPFNFIAARYIQPWKDIFWMPKVRQCFLNFNTFERQSVSQLSGLIWLDNKISRHIIFY